MDVKSPGTELQRDPATVIIMRSVKPGFRTAHDQWLQRLMHVVSGFPGYRSITVIQPPATTSSGAYTVVLSFDTRADLRAWQQSPEHQHLIAEADQWFEGPPRYQEATGYELWFDTPSGPRLASWRQALVLWLVLTPLTSFLLPPIAAFLSQLMGLIAAAYITSGLMIIFMTWGLMPIILRLFGRWLYAKSPQASAAQWAVPHEALAPTSPDDTTDQPASDAVNQL